MGWKCRDCKVIITAANCTQQRISVCDECWDLRGQCIKAVQDGLVTPTEFSRIQKTTVRARRMRELLAGAESERRK
jgi:hypothetical protein